MSLVSMLFVGVMLVSCGIMAYKRATKGIVIVFTLLSYGMFVFAKDLYFSENPFFWYLISLIVLSLFLYKRYGPQCFGAIFFMLPCVVTTRAMGFPDSPDFGEKAMGSAPTSGICFIFSLWLLFLKYHQKILFAFFSVCLVGSLCFLAGIEFQKNSFEWIAFLYEWLISIDIVIALSSSPIGYIFFLLGEFILLFLCVIKPSPKIPKNPPKTPTLHLTHPKTPNA